MPTASPSQPENVFLFIPNLIGYSRVVLAIASLYYMPLHPRTCSFLYSISCLLDALDGMAARIYNQATQFGTVLDMVTDRCTTSCLLCFLATAFPRWSIVFQLLISLDLASHYMHMYATLAMGGKAQSHKKVDDDKPWAMRLYYSDNRVLFVVCLMNELFFIALYLYSFSSPAHMSSTDPTAGLTWPTQWSAGAMEMARANKIDSTVPGILLGVSCIFMLFKQYINVVQLIEASKWLADGDIKRRKACIS